MARVTCPLFSLAASGSVGDIITFVCGQFARKKSEGSSGGVTESQTANQMKWSEGCHAWQLLGVDKETWNVFLKRLRTDESCATQTSYIANGFQLFMSFYMKWGPGNWPNYPLPPI